MKTDHFFPKKAESQSKKSSKEQCTLPGSEHCKKKSLKPLKSKYNFPSMFTENITGVGKGTKEDTEKRVKISDIDFHDKVNDG